MSKIKHWHKKHKGKNWLLAQQAFDDLKRFLARLNSDDDLYKEICGRQIGTIEETYNKFYATGLLKVPLKKSRMT